MLFHMSPAAADVFHKGLRLCVVSMKDNSLKTNKTDSPNMETKGPKSAAIRPRPLLIIGQHAEPHGDPTSARHMTCNRATGPRGAARDNRALMRLHKEKGIGMMETTRHEG